MRIALLFPLLTLALTGCSNIASSSDATGVGAGVYYGGYYGNYPWWYDDYYYYRDDYYPWCCDNEEDFDELLKKWWSGLDEERQQEIKDKFQDWQVGNGQPDVAALRTELAGYRHAMTQEQQQALRDNRQNRLSVSNPNIAPRSPLDDKAGALPTGNNNASSPLTRLKMDTRPHLPRAIVSPMRTPRRR